VTSPWIDKAKAWAENDVDSNDIAFVRALIDQGDLKTLEDLFCRSAKFGTAGLRELVGPGPSQLNSAVVRRATYAVGKHLLLTDPNPGAHTVVLGWDARLSSERFARDTAGVLVAMGIHVQYFEEPVPTPLVAFALLEVGASAAVVITASHNGPAYNGYKLYAKNGAQIVSPVDVEIAKSIEMGPGAKEIAFSEGSLSGKSSLARPISVSLVDRYHTLVDALRPKETPSRALPILYTPLHGVGGKPVQRAFDAAGFTGFSIVAEQATPDGTFSTLKRPDGTTTDPNPENAGALELARARGDELGKSLLLANDPDADRLAVCVRDAAGQWKLLSGNQIGVLLGDYQLSRYHGSARALVAYSIVSTPMIRDVAAQYGAHAEATFTGFKWVWTAAIDLAAQQGLQFVFGFEEALGYCAFERVHDKDGVSAALLFAEMAAQSDSVGETIPQRLERLYERHGLWVSKQVSIVREGPSGLSAIRDAVVRVAAKPPTEVNGVRVVGVVDYQVGAETRPRWLAADTMVQLDLEGGTRLLVRPSGTEPKLKIYADLRYQASPGDGDLWKRLGAGEARAATFAKALGMQLGL
jgi:phosphomannomutase